jgi:hypothetical protein
MIHDVSSLARSPGLTEPALSYDSSGIQWNPVGSRKIRGGSGGAPASRRFNSERIGCRGVGKLADHVDDEK